MSNQNPNDQRSDTKNPNNPGHAKDENNQGNQKNPNNPAHPDDGHGGNKDGNKDGNKGSGGKR